MPQPPDQAEIARNYRSTVAHQLPAALVKQASIDPPVLVEALGDFPAFWHVAVRIDGRVVATMDFALSGRLERYGTRLTESADLSELPVDVMEMTLNEISAAARTAVGKNMGIADVATARLIAHDAPTRLAWILEGSTSDGRPIKVFVTPRFTWSAPNQDLPPEV